MTTNPPAAAPTKNEIVTNNGILFGGKYYKIEGLDILSPGAGAPAWVKLDARDYMARKEWLRQLMIHTTKGKWPQPLAPDGKVKGLGGADKIVAEFWRGDPQHSAAQIVIDNDGTIACLCDLLKIAAYHATTSNPWSIGIEMYQEANGTVRQAVYDAMAKVMPFLCELGGFAYQVPGRAYNGTIIQRMKNGGPDMVGVFGHRDVAWDFKANTSTRGRGDPGDRIYDVARETGAEVFDFDARPRGMDIVTWELRQQFLNRSFGASLKVDGIAGPGTMRAMRAAGFKRGADIPV